MTKAELEKEAKDFAEKQFSSFVKGIREIARISFKKGAEPREKQIQIDAEQILALQKQNGELTDRVKELEAQIEKMKSDVKQEQSYWNSCEMQYDLYQRLLDKWEIKEK